MTNQEVKIIIEDYITDDRYNQAILIDGYWGCGKTCFAKGELTQYINEILAKKKANKRRSKKNEEFVIYVSLYGMQNCDEIDSMLATQLWASKKFITKHGVGAIRWLWKQGANVFEHYVGVNLRKDILKSTKSLKEFVLIFDDLERCNIQINEVLGYINRMVEHDQQKVIIVANESEIGKQQGSNNLDSRITLILNEKVKLNEEKALSNTTKEEYVKRLNNNKKTRLSEYTPDDLLYLSEQLSFDDVRYKQIKEKAIGLTIKYEPSLTNLFDELLAKFSKKEESKKIITKCKSDIIDLFNKKCHSNLRTFIFAIIVFEKIHEYIETLNVISEYLEDVLKDILTYCFFITICLKNGENIDPVDYKYGERYMDEQSWFKGKLIKYRFVDKFVMHHFLDKFEIKETVEYDVNYRKENDIAFLKGENWFYSDDSSIEQKLKQLINDLSNNVIKTTYYAQIIHILGEMEKYDIFSDKVNEAFVLMKKNAESHSSYLDGEQSNYIHAYFDNEKSIEIWTELTDIFKENFNKANQSSLETLFSDIDKWGTGFYNYCINTKREQGIVRNFFKMLPLDKIIEAIRNSNAANIHEFRSGLKSIYSMRNMKDFFTEDLMPLKDFRQKIDNIAFKNSPMLCKMALGLLKNEIDNIIKVLSDD